MKQIKQTIDIKELLGELGIELPVEVPEFGASIEYKSGVIQLKAYYDEEAYAKLDITENQLKAWLLNLQMAMMLYEQELTEQLKKLQKELFN